VWLSSASTDGFGADGAKAAVLHPETDKSYSIKLIRSSTRNHRFKSIKGVDIVVFRY